MTCRRRRAREDGGDQSVHARQHDSGADHQRLAGTGREPLVVLLAADPPARRLFVEHDAGGHRRHAHARRRRAVQPDRPEHHSDLGHAARRRAGRRRILGLRLRRRGRCRQLRHAADLRWPGRSIPRYGNADSYDTWDLNGIWGTDLGNRRRLRGGVSTATASQLCVKDRDWASRGDYRDMGGSNTNSFTCEPATIRVTGVSSGTAPGGGQIFLSPGATTPVANNAALNGVCNLSVYNSFIPSQYRANAMIKRGERFLRKALAVGIAALQPQSDARGFRSRPAQQRHRVRRRRGRRGPAESVLHRPCRRAGRQRRRSSTGWRRAKTASTAFTESQQDVIYANVVLDYQISDNWSLTVADSIGWNRSSLDGFKQFCGACATLGAQRHHAVGWQHDGVERPRPERGGAAAAADHQQCARCLDRGRARTAPIRWCWTRSTPHNTQNNNYNTFNQFRAVVQGDLFDLPAGPLKIAVGGEHMWQEQQFKLSGGNNTGPTTHGLGLSRVQLRSRHRVGIRRSGRSAGFAGHGHPGAQQDRPEPRGALRRLLGRGRHHQSEIRHQLEYHGRLPRPRQLRRVVRGAADRGHRRSRRRAISTRREASAAPARSTFRLRSIPRSSMSRAPSWRIPTRPAPRPRRPAPSDRTTRRCAASSVAASRRWDRSSVRAIRLASTSRRTGCEGFRAAVTYFHNDFTGGVNSPSPASITASGSPSAHALPTPRAARRRRSSSSPTWPTAPPSADRFRRRCIT